MQRKHYLLSLIAGMLMPLGFAPFAKPGFVLIACAILFYLLTTSNIKQSLKYAFCFGFGFFAVGTSWVVISIHDYGHLHWIIAAIITLLFTLYLSLYFILMSFCHKKLSSDRAPLILVNALLFSSLWVLFEWFRSTLLTGFPWLLVGTSQIDTPLQNLLPVVGIYGVSFVTLFCACLLASSVLSQSKAHSFLLLASLAFIYLVPSLLLPRMWTNLASEPLRAGIIQTNQSMRDKWDPQLFNQLLTKYIEETKKLIRKQDIIIWPEASLPVAYDYLPNTFSALEKEANENDTALLIGIPTLHSADEQTYFNSLITIGNAKGRYFKQHLVPFGEYLPFARLKLLFDQLNITAPNMVPGKPQKKLLQVKNHLVASLICYELAFPELLRKQMPKASFIVSISDDGWFGHSLALAQHLQMARVLSLLTGRYQIMANNNGLSSIIDARGDITASLPAYASQNLTANLYAASGTTPWMLLGDLKVVLFLFIVVVFLSVISRISSAKGIAERIKREYP